MKFTYQDHELECVQQYKYLGLVFCASGTSPLPRKSYIIKLQRLILNNIRIFFLPLNLKIRTSLHVFDHTIKPILLYGCEIWGSYNCFSSKFKKEVIAVDKIYSNLLCEKLHIK